ncbi:PPOX class F420-dependent oxidoreductase [Amycolatopsis sp. FDAARGOS 1241]|uniref:PPOX class F420-dependent oxidoreductase n=1 Tax=Amycolatopsis sp. FDAARGOS 1241 TaxID=2778070 RepID=UPI0019526911|nr:PPOX class F420-dependent oxidoreductase [Amycolatopsis sp. FDAARGOS 1241]QRP49607.1 PPOX class F420-dependent oxidoreductase [Amycolatopsis sp. FDAARGOS 1241]
MPTPMSAERAREFLAEGNRSAVLATVRADGRPHAVPVWYAPDGADLVVNISQDTVKGRAIAASGQVALVVQEDAPPYTFVTVDGTAEIVTDPTRVRAGSELIARRYLPAEAVDGFVGYATAPGKVLVVIHPAHTVGVDAVAG